MSRLLSIAGIVALSACTTPPSEPVSHAAPPRASSPDPASSTPVPKKADKPELTSFPHDITSFTEGLLFDHGVLYESTGMYGESKLLRIDLSTGRVLTQVRLTGTYFGEGLSLLHGELFQLTYRENRCFVYDATTLEKKRELRYDGEGWGLTNDGTRFIMSDGTPTLTFRDATTFAPTGTITVRGPNGPVANINELEWVDGFILANVWETNVIVRIDPATGGIVQTIDLAYLPEPRRGTTDDDVLNGIAWDAAGARLLVTGKRWSRIFQIPKPW